MGVKFRTIVRREPDCDAMFGALGLNVAVSLLMSVGEVERDAATFCLNRIASRDEDQLEQSERSRVSILTGGVVVVKKRRSKVGRIIYINPASRRRSRDITNLPDSHRKHIHSIPSKSVLQRGDYDTEDTRIQENEKEERATARSRMPCIIPNGCKEFEALTCNEKGRERISYYHASHELCDKSG